MPERIGDMDPKSHLEIYRDASGDIVVQVFQFGRQGLTAFAEVEFCTISMGAGQSPRTFDALLKLIEAMEEDNKKGRLAKLPTIIEDSERKNPFEGHIRYTSNFPSEPE